MIRLLRHSSFLLCVLVTSVPSAAEEWPGFRGQELQGRAALSAPPIRGTNGTSVLWASGIPGDVYSSPIVSGDSVYVTTAYQTMRFKLFRRVLAGLVIALAIVLCVGGAAGLLFRQPAHRLQFHRLRCLALPFLIGVLVAGVFVWSGRRFRMDEVSTRAWLTSVAVVLTALAMAGVSLPLRARASAIIGWLLIGFAVVALLCHPERDELLVVDSLSALAALGALLVGPVAGAGLLVMRRMQAKRLIHDGDAVWGRGRTHMLVWSAVVLGAVVFAEANCALSRNEMAGAVVSLSLQDGRPQWVRETLTCPKRRLPGMNTPATPTAVTDGRHIFAWFGSAGVVCLDAAGNIVWTQRRFLSEPRYGAVTSPVLKDGVLVLVGDMEARGRHDRSARAWIAGVDAATGECLWQQQRRAYPKYAGYATPVVGERDGKSVVWVHGWYGLDGYDVRTGNSVGRYAYDFDAAHLVASPVLEGDRLFIPGAKVHLCVDLAKVTAGEDGLVWSRKAVGEISATPVVAAGLVFLVSETGKAMCLDLATGACQWEERLPGRYWASPVACAGCVCFCNEKGQMTVLAAEREFRVVARHEVGEPIHASPAAVGNLLVRTDRNVVCLRHGD